MLVHFVTDEPTKMPAIRAMLEPQHVVEPRLLGVGDRQIVSSGVLMVDADLRRAAPVEQIKLVLQDLRCVSEKLFVVQNRLHQMVAQALALGATAVVSRPREIVSKLAQIEVAQRVARADIVSGSPGIATSAAAFASMFSAIREGKPLVLSDAQNATSEGVPQRRVDGIMENCGQGLKRISRRL